jgi:hypothetical protein
LLFLYRQVLEIDLPYIDDIERAKRPERLPVVFTRIEVNQLKVGWVKGNPVPILL